MVLEDGVTEVQLEADSRLEAFASAMNLGKQPRDNLLRLYQGWAAVLDAYRASRITGAFNPNTLSREERRSAIMEFERIERDISVLRNHAAKEKQINRRVELNHDAKRMEAQLDAVRRQLSTGGQQPPTPYNKENRVKKIQPGDPESMSQDVVAQNIEQLRSMFPEAWTEGRLDFDILKQLLGGLIDDRDEKYAITWYGKRNARRLALTPSHATLRHAQKRASNGLRLRISS